MSLKLWINLIPANINKTTVLKGNMFKALKKKLCMNWYSPDDMILMSVGKKEKQWCVFSFVNL